jgi:rare lipoprotein A
MSRLLVTAWLAIIAVSACTSPTGEEARHKRPSQVGIASWYGPGFHGKRTTSGAVYDQNGLTAAHQTLPLGSSVRVTNLQNKKTIEVVINDRGPFAKGRIIDLSYAAAKKVAMIGPGTARVLVEVLDDRGHGLTRIPERLDYTVQVGAFSGRANAVALKKRLDRRYEHVVIENHRDHYQVQIGVFATYAEAKRYAENLAHAGFRTVVVEKLPAPGPREES